MPAHHARKPPLVVANARHSRAMAVLCASIGSFLARCSGTPEKLSGSERRAASPEESYVANLVARGLPVIARKLGDEAVEAVVAALTDNREELVGEAADVMFHLLVLLAEKDIELAEVLAELDRREGTSGLGEKAARGT